MIMRIKSKSKMKSRHNRRWTYLIRRKTIARRKWQAKSIYQLSTRIRNETLIKKHFDITF